MIPLKSAFKNGWVTRAAFRSMGDSCNCITRNPSQAWMMTHENSIPGFYRTTCKQPYWSPFPQQVFTAYITTGRDLVGLVIFYLKSPLPFFIHEGPLESRVNSDTMATLTPVRWYLSEGFFVLFVLFFWVLMSFNIQCWFLLSSLKRSLFFIHF